MTKTSPSLKEVRLETIIDSIDEAIIGCDKNGIINIYNSANERREKLDRKDALNRHVDEVYDFHGAGSLMMKAIREKRPIIDQYQEYTTNQGNYVEIICSTVPIKEGGEIVGAVSVMKDYSKMKKLSNIIADLQTNLYGKGSSKSGKSSQGSSGARHTFEDIVGENRLLKETLLWARKTAANSLPVLIYGETGTGKELLAQGIHNQSDRRNKPFIAINCAAIPENLLEGLLFGTVKGAFTGAVDKPGLFEQASGGTLILDEINSMSTALQSKLLRVIQEDAVRRVGDLKERAIDTRLISISNSEPQEAIREEKLREDLFYRIAYISLCMPPLRDRLDDLPRLADHIIKCYNQRLGLSVSGVSEDLLTLLMNYWWPGNVRELEHIIASGMSSLRQDSKTVDLECLPPAVRKKICGKKEIPEQVYSGDTLEEIMNKLEIEVVREALKRNSWNISATARDLGIKRQSLQYRIRKHALRPGHKPGLASENGTGFA